VAPACTLVPRLADCYNGAVHTTEGQCTSTAARGKRKAPAHRPLRSDRLSNTHLATRERALDRTLPELAAQSESDQAAGQSLAPTPSPLAASQRSSGFRLGLSRPRSKLHGACSPLSLLGYLRIFTSHSVLVDTGTILSILPPGQVIHWHCPASDKARPLRAGRPLPQLQTISTPRLYSRLHFREAA
jgi:hypothetical protein